MIEEKINYLNGKIIGYAYLVEKMIDKTIFALRNQDQNAMKEVIEEMEPQSNNTELKIEKEGILILARFSPMAQGLRTVLMILKMSNDLERMADNCENICKGALNCLEMTHLSNDLDDTIALAVKVKGMLKDSMDCFINQDTFLAKKVIKSDKEINEFRNESNKILVSKIMEESDNVTYLLEIMKMNDRLERIADLTTNIAEDVIYIAKGKQYKHK